MPFPYGYCFSLTIKMHDIQIKMKVQEKQQFLLEDVEGVNFASNLGDVIYSWFSRWCTVWGSNTGLCLVGPTKVKDRKSIVFTEVSLILHTNKVTWSKLN